MTKRTWRPSTQMVHGGTERSAFGENCEGLYLTSGFIYDSAEQQEATFKDEIQRFQYARYASPTVKMFEDRLAMMEGAKHCLATASGMAAINMAMMAQLKAGDRVVASRALFGSCLFILNTILPRFGIETVLVDGYDLDQWADAFKKPTRCVLLETPANPTLEVVDMKAVCDLAHASGARVNNVFATPVLQRPLDWGADIVVYSTTKHIDGQGRTMGGAVLFNDDDLLKNEMMPFFRNTGPTMSPFSAWTQLKGLETLALRVKQHCDSAAEIATFLEARDEIRKVNYPGLKSHPQHDLAMAQMSGSGGPMVSFEINGTKEQAFAFENALSLVGICNNLGDSKSLITHPATTTHSKVDPVERDHLGITDALVRVSVGLEDVDDLKEDMDAAFKVAFG